MKPSTTPASDSRPARGPCVRLRETQYTMFGPGVSTRASAARENSSSSRALNITLAPTTGAVCRAA